MLLGICAFIPAAHTGPFDLPDMGSTADAVMSSSDERRLGQAFMRSVREALPVMQDPLITDYIESLGSRLVAASDLSLIHI